MRAFGRAGAFLKTAGRLQGNPGRPDTAMSDEPRLSCTITRAARILDCGRGTVRRLLDRGVLTGFRFRTGPSLSRYSQWRVFEDSIRALQGDDAPVLSDANRPLSRAEQREVDDARLGLGLPPLYGGGAV